MNQPQAVIACKQLAKTFSTGPEVVKVLHNIQLTVAAGETVSVIGTSGSGKSTLLNLLGALDVPSSGELFISGENIAELSESKRDQLRNEKLGFVYQFHHLLNEFTALENVAMPLLIRGEKKRLAKQAAATMLEKVGLARRLKHRPNQLSGGERQRVAIARALVTQPQCVLMDEPTGNLDRHTAATIHELMASLNANLATSFIIVTHDNELAATMQQQYQLIDGELHRVVA